MCKNGRMQWGGKFAAIIMVVHPSNVCSQCLQAGDGYKHQLFGIKAGTAFHFEPGYGKIGQYGGKFLCVGLPNENVSSYRFARVQPSAVGFRTVPSIRIEVNTRCPLFFLSS